MGYSENEEEERGITKNNSGGAKGIICFCDFNKELLSFLLRYIIMSKETYKNHEFKDGDMVFYYDSVYSNIHRLDLKEYKDLHQEVLDNTKRYNEGKKWDLLNGIYFYLPDNKKVMEIIKNSKNEGIKK